MSDPIDDARDEGMDAGVSSPGEPHRSRRDAAEEPARRTAPLILVATAILLVVALAFAVSSLRPSTPEVATTAKPPSTAPTAPATTPSTSSASVAKSPVSTSASAPTAPTAPSPTTATATATVTATQQARSREAAALSELNSIATRDQGRAPRPGQIVAQLQNRTVGMSDPVQRPASGNATWTAADILAYHREASNRAGGATLLKEAGHWVTVTWNPAWTSREQAIGWCQRAFSEYPGAYADNTPLRNRCYVTSAG